MPDLNKFRNAKYRLIRVLRKLIAESEQIARDIAWWNKHRTDAPPFDNGGDLAYAALARQCLALAESNQPIPDELWDRLTAQARENANV